MLGIDQEQFAVMTHNNELGSLSNIDMNSSQNLSIPDVGQSITMAMESRVNAQTEGVILFHWDHFEINQPNLDSRGQKEYDLVVALALPKIEPWLAPTFHALQEWEGYVIEISDTSFMARLVDLTAGLDQAEEEAEIPMSEVSAKDAVKMCLGSVFHWVIGYERSLAGTKRRVSEIVFRDVPPITEKDLRDGEAWALGVIQSFNL